MGNIGLGTAENHLDITEKRWFAVYTPYKREKLATKMLDKKGIDVFLPLQTLHRQYQRTKLSLIHI